MQQFRRYRCQALIRSLRQNHAGERHHIATFQYTGDYCHVTSELYLTKYRAFDPNTGKWLARDALPDVEQSEGPNLYDYVHNNPVNNTDQMGLADTYWTQPLHPSSADGFIDQSNVVGPAIIHQAQKAIDAVANFFGGGGGDPAGANNTAAKVAWLAPCGNGDILDMIVLTKPSPDSGNPEFFGTVANLEVKTRYAVSHASSEAIQATTAKFKCKCLSP